MFCYYEVHIISTTELFIKDAVPSFSYKIPLFVLDPCEPCRNYLYRSRLLI